MCGRFTLGRSPREVAETFELEETPELAPRFNIAPGQAIATIGADAGSARRLVLRRWGLVPHWSEGPGAGVRLINARSETAATRPAFREAFRRRRCLVPADGFYEWSAPRERGDAGPRQPFHIGLPGGALFAIAGLWERWDGPDGRRLESCTLLTTAANARIAEIHDRMPAILLPADCAAWLDPERREPTQLEPLLQPLAPEAMELRPVSPRVNDVRCDDADLLAPYEPPPRPVQGALF